MTQQPGPPEAVSAERHQELLGFVLGALERTFAQEGQVEGLRALRALLARLDERTLTDLVYALGLETEPGKDSQEDRR